MSAIEAFAPRHDALVVGARCAGAATALLLARAGAKVLLVDRQPYGSDTASTHALMRGAVLQLERWGLLARVMAAGTPAVRRSTFHYGAETVAVEIRPEHGVTHLAAPRRTVLDRVLVDAAREAGVEVRHGVTLAGLERGPDGRVVGARLKGDDGDAGTVAAGIVIGADGRQSTVARLVGAEPYVRGASASGYVYGYFEGMADDGYHWYFERNVAAGVIPTNGGRHCVFVGVPRAAFQATFRGDLAGGFRRIAARNAAALAAEVDRARPAGRLRGFACEPGYLRHCFGPGWALVGDAGYFKDPLTAHGITDAFRDAELVSNAAVEGSAGAFRRYREERDALSRPLLAVTDAIAGFAWDMARIKHLHGRLSAAMKAEAARVAGYAAPRALAA